MRGTVLDLKVGLLVGAGCLTTALALAQAQNAAPGTAPARAIANTVAAALVAPPGSASVNTWVTYKGDPQRTGISNVNLPLPLNLVWRHSTDGAPRSNGMSPLVSGPPEQRRVYYGAGKNVLCLDAQTGAEIWRSKPLAGIAQAPITLLPSDAGDLILAVSTQGQLSALNAADGQLVWRASARAEVQNAAPIIVRTPKGQRIIVALATGHLIAYTLEGSLDPEWDVKLGRYGAAPNSTPALSTDGQSLFLTTQDQRVYVVDIARAAVSFTIQLPYNSFATPLVAGDQVVLTAGSIIASYNESNAIPQWRRNLGENADVAASPAGRVGADGNGVIYCGSRNGKLYALNAKDGAVIWQSKLEASVSGSPVILPNAILVGTRNGGGGGEFFALQPQDGKIIWRYRLRSDSIVLPKGTAPAGSSGGYPGGSGGGGYPGGSGGEGGGGYPGGGSGGSEGGSGGSGGGYPGGGGAEGGSGDLSSNMPTVQRTTFSYGISAPPSVVEGQVFLLTDHGALYGFNVDALDPEPPRVLTPSLNLTDDKGALRPFLLDTDKPLMVPGSAPLYFVAELDDAGSGVDATSVQASFDDQPLAADKLKYTPAKGLLILTLLSTPKGGGEAALPDGLHTINVTAQDYRGNALNYKRSFTVDKNTPPPAYAPPEPVLAPPGGGYPGSSGGYPGSSGGYPGGSSSSSGYPGRGSSAGYPGGSGSYPGGSGGYPGSGSSSSSAVGNYMRRRAPVR